MHAWGLLFSDLFCFFLMFFFPYFLLFSPKAPAENNNHTA